MAVSLVSLAFVAFVGLYHGDARRCALTRCAPLLVATFRVAGWLLLAAVMMLAVRYWGAERGIAITLVAASLAALASLLVASRWPLLHLGSAPVIGICAAVGALV